MGCILFHALLLDTQAASETQFMITPSIVDLSILRGGVKMFPLEITNLSREKGSRFRIYVQDLKMRRDGSIEFLPSGATDRSCARWIILTPTEVTVGPNSSTKIVAKIAPPASITAGGYYAAIICEFLPGEQGALEQGVKITWRMASLVRLIVTGGRLIKKIRIENLKLEFSGRERTEGITFLASLKNGGNIHVHTEGRLIVRTADRRRKGQVCFDVGTGTVLPGGIRDFAAIYDRFLPAGEYIAEAIFRYGGYNPVRTEIPFSVTMNRGRGIDTDEESHIVILEPIVIKPSFLEFEIPAGGFHTGSITILNQMEESVLIKVSVVGGQADKDVEEISSPDIVDWLNVSPSEFTLTPSRAKRVILRFTIPEKMSGLRIFRILFTPILDNDQTGISSVEATVRLNIPDFTQ